MKVLILTDSLGLPRNSNGEFVKYEETYPYLLKKEFADKLELIHVGIGGATIEDIRKQISYYTVLDPDITFIQCGIVDCAPRAFRKFESKVIKKLKFDIFFKPLVRFLRIYRKHTYTSQRMFKNTIQRIKKDPNIARNLHFIGILPAHDEYEKIMPGIKSQIEIYNRILAKENNFIDNSDFPFSGILKDYHHLNKEGNQLIYSKLSEVIKRNII